MHKQDEVTRFMKDGDTLIEWHGKLVRMVKVLPNGQLRVIEIQINKADIFGEVCAIMANVFYDLHKPEFIIE